MRELVFLLEEESAKAMLEGLLPRILLPEIHYRLIPFEGKQDLERQLVRKIRAYRNPEAHFIVMRDQDSHADCHELKATLKALCQEAGRPDTIVRIVCRELESFYIADLAAVEAALGLANLARHQRRRKFRTPDAIASPSAELVRLTDGRYQKVGGSRAIGRYLDADNTRSASFRALIVGIRRLASSGVRRV
jgi:hypothetical protein